MKRLTIVVLMFGCIALALTAGGKSDDSMMMEKEMDSDMTDSAMMSPVQDFPGIDKAMKTAGDKPTVLFFHASWCPTCKAAMKDLEMNLSMLEGVQIYIVDYDTTKDLQMKYGVTYQHTFVQIDTMGEALATWNGGASEEILDNTMMKEM